MVPEAKAVKLIEIYFYICEKHDNEFKYCCVRFSNNNRPELTDQETMANAKFTLPLNFKGICNIFHT